MQVSLEWLSDFVETGTDVPALSRLLTMGGFEVEAAETAAPAFDQVVVGEVVEVARHPDADKLSVCKVAGGGEGLLTIVCGASNVRAGMKTALAAGGRRIAGWSGDPQGQPAWR